MQLRKRLQAGFLTLIQYLAVEGDGVNKNLLGRQKFDTNQKLCQIMINNVVRRDKKYFVAVSETLIHS